MREGAGRQAGDRSQGSSSGKGRVLLRVLFCFTFETDRVSRVSGPDCPETHQAGLELTEMDLPLPPKCTTTPDL